MKRPVNGMMSMALVALAAIVSYGADLRAENDLPPDFVQLLPKGKIAAVRAPSFVAVEEAEIPGDAWVLGVEVNGEARAYSLNLLNRHEIVNDRIGGLPIAAVW